MAACHDTIADQMRGSAASLARFHRLYGRDEQTGTWSPEGLLQASADLDRPIPAEGGS